MSENNILKNMLERKKQVNREASLYTGRLKLERALKRLKSIPLETNRQQEAAKKIQKAWKEYSIR